MNESEAKLLGMHAGDGTLYQTTRSLVWELRGDIKEKEYYDGYVISLISRIFSIQLIPKFRSGGKNGCYGIQTSNKEITSFFLQNGFPIGKKSHSVRLPHSIKSEAHQRAFLSGYFDTDGCLRFDKNHGSVHKYPKIEFASKSAGLMTDVSLMLDGLQFRHHQWSDHGASKLCISGRESLIRWFKEIRPSNQKHLNKYLIFRQMGCYAAVAQPGTAQT